jgi:hypothetical protein
VPNIRRFESPPMTSNASALDEMLGRDRYVDGVSSTEGIPRYFGRGYDEIPSLGKQRVVA